MKRQFAINGFSLAEFLITLGLFMILVASLSGTLMIGLRYYRESNLGVDVQKAVRDSIEYMTDDLRQAVPNEDPGIFGNQPTGYRIISPSIVSTGVIYPNVNTPKTDYLIFNKPNYTYYDPGNVNWNALDPRNFKKIRYYIQDGNKLKREVILFKSDGKEDSKTSHSVAEIDNGSIKLTCNYVYNSGSIPYYRISITATSGKKTFSLSSNCVIPSRSQ